MDNKIISAFLALHGLMFALLGFVDIIPAFGSTAATYEPFVGWTGTSWLLSDLLGRTTIITAALIGYFVSTMLFVFAALIFMGDNHYWRVSILTACIFSSLVLIIFWDGSFENIMQKGFIGLILNILIGILVNHK